MKKLAITCLMMLGLAFGQASKPAAKKPAARTAKKPATGSKVTAKPAASSAAGLPSRAVVQSFLNHTFGWDKTLTITVVDIKPSAAATVAEVDLHAVTPKGAGDSAIYVTHDQKFAIAGQMQPFGGKPGEKPTNDQIDGFMRQMTAQSPGLTWSVYEVKPNGLSNLTEVTVLITNTQGQRGAQKLWVSPDGQHALFGEVQPFGADPFAAVRTELQKGINGPTKGAANATITLVEFADLECPSCKAAAPTVARLLSDIPNAKLVFQQFPLTQIHHWAYKAATFGACVAQRDNSAFFKYMDAVYAVQEDISAHVETAAPGKQPDLSYAEQKLTELATQSGLDGKQIAACAADPATALHVDHSMALGKQVDVTGTPTVFVNGRKITSLNSMPYETLKKIVEFAGTPAGK